MRLPLGTLREWSEPFARTVDVAVVDLDMDEATISRATLPIGLLGHVAELDTLIVTDH
ncbi:hypothetical protein [Novosphingobium sp. M1R2S20]|uniref:Uncharacterized protein n=1 Tax=Novosphingobium rhizovicinum TaxID=3228928 RepID=A0ABV3RGC5_9SPHN